jgi:hypothetical protein
MTVIFAKYEKTTGYSAWHVHWARSLVTAVQMPRALIGKIQRTVHQIFFVKPSFVCQQILLS